MFPNDSTNLGKVIMAVSVAALVSISADASARPRLQTGPDTEITHDGLHRVDKTVMDMAWVKPDLDLTAYDSLMFVGAGMSFRTVDSTGRRYWPGRSDDTEFPISDENRIRLREELREVFLDEMSELERYEIVTQPGRGVLLLAIGLIDVVSQVPPQNACVGRCDFYLTSVGEATLIVELRDSMSNEILVRAVDRRAAESSWPIEASPVTAWAEVRRLGRSWASIIRRRLDDFDSIDDLR